jgi:uncharacterized protein YcfJ
MSKRKIISGLAAAGLLLTGSVAMADPHGWEGHRGWDGHRGWEREGGARDSGYDYARVVDVEPLRTRVRISEPRQECYQETRYEGGYERPGRDTVTPTVLGGLLGAAVGHQIGHGDGRRVATVAGALIGAGIAHDAADRQAGRYGYAAYEEPQPYAVQRCATRYEDRYEERIEGYRVTYDYHGRRGVMQMPYDPGDHIRVRVEVSPDCPD